MEVRVVFRRYRLKYTVVLKAFMIKFFYSRLTMKQVHFLSEELS